MRILFVGDIVGSAGRKALETHLPDLKEKLSPDIVIVNGENAAHGLGITEKICAGFYELGVDVITTGNHIWDQRDIIEYIDTDNRLLRPVNYPELTPGKGAYLHKLEDGRKILVINVMARLFMDPLDDPFVAVRQLVDQHKLVRDVNAIFIDLHGEATSEKMAMAQWLNGEISALVGTHTHLPTGDTMILSEGTAFQSDAGMTGDYDSVIGVKKEIAINRFTSKLPGSRMQPAEGEGTLCGLFVETDDETGKAMNAAPVRVGPLLINTIPGF